MFRVRRVRVVLREDGEVLTWLGAEVAGPERIGALILMRRGVTVEGWEKGIWIRVDSISGPARGKLLETEEKCVYMMGFEEGAGI